MVATSPKPLSVKDSNITVVPHAARKIKKQKLGYIVQKLEKCRGKRCKSTKMSEIWEKMGNPMPFKRIMGYNQGIKQNYDDLQPIARSMKPTLWVPSKNLSFGLLP